MLTTSIDEVIRRLLLLGLPLAPLACGSHATPIACHPQNFDGTLIVPRPSADADGGGQLVTLDAWQACADSQDCLALCKEETRPIAGPPTCGWVGNVAATDSGEPAVEIHLAYQYEDCTGRRPAGLGRARQVLAAILKVTGRLAPVND